MESALAVERENQQILFQSDDAKEGLAAYVEKRQPYSQPSRNNLNQGGHMVHRKLRNRLLSPCSSVYPW